MSTLRLNKSALTSFAGVWEGALAQVERVDESVELAPGEVKRADTQELIPDTASILVITGTAGPDDKWSWAMLVDATAAAAADVLAPLVAPDLREPDGTTNALLAVAAYAGNVADSSLAALGTGVDWGVVQGWQGLLERADLNPVADGEVCPAPGMEGLLRPNAVAVGVGVEVRHADGQSLELHFILDPDMVGELARRAAESAATGDAAPDGDDDADDLIAAAAGDTAAPVEDEAAAAVTVQPAAFEGLNERYVAQPEDMPAGIGLLMDVPLQLTVELGRAKRTIRDVLAVGPGSVVELERLAGEPVDVLVNGKLLGKGEVVVINENFGVRLTDIISPVERLQGLE